MRIQVIANCQARPISMLLPHITPDAETLEPIILHLAKAEEQDAHLAQIETADVIFAQLTVDEFQPAHLSTSFLKQRYGDKVVIWPNIFYMGQQPYLRYFTKPGVGRLMGPMEALHDIRLYHSWKTTGQVKPEALDINDPDFVTAIRAASLAELRAKEAKCDVTISDFLTAHEDQERLFFTFNHPAQMVLSEMARRMFAALGKNDTQPAPDGGPEPLSRYQVPSVWQDGTATFQGDPFSIDPADSVQRFNGPPQKYSLEDLCMAYQKTYDSDDIYRSFEGVRLTPRTDLDQVFLAS